MNIPWKIKSFSFHILSYLPDRALYLTQRYITRRSKVGIKDIYVGWQHHADVIDQTGATRLIEFGAGKTLAQNLFLSTKVNHQTVVDLFAMAEIPMINLAIDQLRVLEVPLDGRHIKSFQELEDIYNIRYLAPFDIRDSGLKSDHFDICVSTNTLEHIPAPDIKKIFKELYRILAPGGTVSAMIDYSDHYAHSDKTISRLHYLQFSEKSWAKHNHSNHYQNRMRHNHYKDIFSHAGFGVSDENPTDVADPTGLHFKDVLLTQDDTDHATTGFWILRK